MCVYIYRNKDTSIQSSGLFRPCDCSLKFSPLQTRLLFLPDLTSVTRKKKSTWRIAKWFIAPMCFVIKTHTQWPVFFQSLFVDDWIILCSYDADDFCYEGQKAQLRRRDFFNLSCCLQRLVFGHSKARCRNTVLICERAADFSHLMTNTAASKQSKSSGIQLRKGPPHSWYTKAWNGS